MKSLLIIATVFILIGCGGTKKASTSKTRDQTQTSISIESQRYTDSVKVREIELRKLVDSVVVWEEIITEYEHVVVEDGQKVEAVPVKKQENRQKQSKTSEEVQSTKDNTKQQEKAEETTNVRQDKDVEQEEEKEEEPKDPFLTRYRFYILLLIVLTGLFFYLKSKFKIL